jgi:glycosyltransferase involved in cell wall biosynthesis
MQNILLVAPVTGGNGGINSWTKKYLENFCSDEFNLIPADSSLKHRLFDQASAFKRIVAGLLDLRDLIKAIRIILGKHHISIMHITTSGSFGTLRDYVLCRICRKQGIRTIMHCRYGNIPAIIEKNGLRRNSLLKTMYMYDQIWVLDSTSESVLKNIAQLQGKIRLIPNSIYVPPTYDNTLKTFRKIAFVGNLIPSKGIFELIEAVKRIDKEIYLFIAGSGDESVTKRIYSSCNGLLGSKIHLLGSLPNSHAIEIIKSVDILALPTYYPAEAFPVSILEAMSHGKMVISTHRAAIPEMLTALDGSSCGMIIPEMNIPVLQHAIEYCIDHPEESGIICKKAYEKVWSVYRNEVVYGLYKRNYRLLMG